MRARVLVLVGASLVAVVALRRRSTSRPSPSTGLGWRSCSAPSAAWYDALFGGPLRGLQQHVAADLLVLTGDTPVSDVLDIGSGPGILAVELGHLAPSTRITGIDIDPDMVERASTRAAHSGLDGRISFQAGDVAELPFPNASFDVVTSTFSVHHWTDAAAGFAEIRRVLRPGGRAIIYDLPDWWGRIERGAGPLATGAAGAGFAATRTTVFRWPWRVPLATRLEARVPTAGPPG
jgi:SAM-dependent methyltransferase